MTSRIHHSAICTRIEGSLRFWRDGLGFVPTMDYTFKGDWKALFNAPENTLHSIFLGPSGDADSSGIVELVDFGEFRSERGHQRPRDRVLSRIGVPRRRRNHSSPDRARTGRRGAPGHRSGGVRMAVVRDPNGVLVELIDAAAVRGNPELASSGGS